MRSLRCAASLAGAPSSCSCCTIMPLSSRSAVAETLGFNLLLLGPVVNSSLNRHLAGEAPDAEGAQQQQIVIFRRGVGALGRPGPSEHRSCSNGSWTGDDIDLLEQGKGFAQLRLRMTGSGGVTTECFTSEEQSLEALLRRCNGQAAFDKAVYDTCQRIHKLEGTLQWNWFHIGYDTQGKLGVLCLTCNDGCSHAIGKAHGNPFNNFIRHCTRSNEHKEARARAQQLADAVMATYGGECLSRREPTNLRLNLRNNPLSPPDKTGVDRHVHRVNVPIGTGFIP